MQQVDRRCGVVRHHAAVHVDAGLHDTIAGRPDSRRATRESVGGECAGAGRHAQWHPVQCGTRRRQSIRGATATASWAVLLGYGPQRDWPLDHRRGHCRLPAITVASAASIEKPCQLQRTLAGGHRRSAWPPTRSDSVPLLTCAANHRRLRARRLVAVRRRQRDSLRQRGRGKRIARN
jgi:hypothetical protein